ncbi:unnamed protein product [Pleuronectes platessa]|uniref:Uncharacterized protein n=1 Tax=Pleuronectes platessa TaxID=8262 RepID=A0A9N7W0E3_PLEPL|nr:unnamed protein product [Pleuronectes platessa]
MPRLGTDLSVSSLSCDRSFVLFPLRTGDEGRTRARRLYHRPSLLNLRIIPFCDKKADRLPILQTLQKSKQSGPGIAVALLRLHVSHKGRPSPLLLLPPTLLPESQCEPE